MYPPNQSSSGYNQFALGDNMALAQKMREQRMYEDMTQPGAYRLIGGPQPDPNWDAFFGAVQQKQQDAADAGMGFKLGFKGAQRSPAMAGLASAVGARFKDPRVDPNDPILHPQGQ